MKVRLPDFSVEDGPSCETGVLAGTEIISTSAGFKWLMDPPPVLAETPRLQKPPIPSTSLRATR